MTDWQARLNAKLTAKREEKASEPVHCDECGKEVEFPCESETRAGGRVKQCFPCWWKNKLAKGEGKWWLKPEFGNAGERSRASQSKRSRRTSRRG